MRGSLRRGLALVRRRTPRGPALHVRLYEKPGCHLCEDAYRTLTRVRMEVPLEIERVDIEREAALFDRYALRIPVLALSAHELDAAGVDERAVSAWLRGVTD